MFTSVFEKIWNSNIMKSLRGLIMSIVTTLKGSVVKSNADEMIREEREKTSNDNLVGMFYDKISTFVASFFAMIGLKNSKVARVISRIVSIILGLGFMLLTLYIAIKIFPKIIVFIATLFAFAIILEIILAVLSTAVGTVQVQQ